MDEITGISLIVLLAALSLPLISALMSKTPKTLKVVKYLLLLCYIEANLYLTIFSRRVSLKPKSELDLLWSYRKSLSYSGSWLDLITGNWGKLKITDYKLLKQIILNVLLYMPFGYLLPFTWPCLAERRCGEEIRFRYILVLLIGFICSALTELSQLYFHVGLFEFDDMLNNTLGCFLGLILYKLLIWNKREKNRGEELGEK